MKITIQISDKELGRLLPLDFQSEESKNILKEKIIEFLPKLPVTRLLVDADFNTNYTIDLGVN